MSSVTRRATEQAIKDANRVLYAEYGLDAAAQPRALDCFFLKGAEADPEDSIIIQMYRITQRKLEVDRMAGSAGVRVAWETTRVLVPRSKQASGSHGRTVQIEMSPAEYGTAQRAAAADLERLTQSHKAALAERQRQLEGDIRSSREAEASQLAALEKRSKTRVHEATALIARLDAEEQATLASKEQEYETRQKGISSRHEPPLHAARNRERALLKSIDGFAGFVKIELLGTILFALALFLVAGWGVVSLVPALVCAIVAGRVVRTIVATRAAAPRIASETALKRDLRECASKSEERTRAIRQQFAERRKPVQDTLAAVAKEKANIEAAARQRVAALEQQRGAEAAKATADFDARTKQLRSQLCRVETVKQLSQKAEFPAYRAARDKGYSDGDKPSSYEVDMTPTEMMQARLLLQRY